MDNLGDFNRAASFLQVLNTAVSTWNELLMTTAIGLVATCPALPAREPDLPDGKGRPVLVVHGFGHSGYETNYVRDFLTAHNFEVYMADIGLNLGPDAFALSNLERQAAAISAYHGGQEVMAVGHSLGGIFVNALKEKRPDLFDKCVLLGSPIHAGPETGLTYQFAKTTEALLPPTMGRRDDPSEWLSIHTTHDPFNGDGDDCYGPGQNIEREGGHLSMLLDKKIMRDVVNFLGEQDTPAKPAQSKIPFRQPSALLN